MNMTVHMKTEAREDLADEHDGALEDLQDGAREGLADEHVVAHEHLEKEKTTGLYNIPKEQLQQT